MPVSTSILLLVVICASSLSAAGIVALLGWLSAIGLGRPRPGPEGRSVFLFDGDALVDATPPARRLLDRLEGRGSERDLLTGLLEHRFPGLAQRLARIEGDGRFALEARGGLGRIEVEHWDGLVRVGLHPQAPGRGGDSPIDPIAFAALEDELETLRCIGDDAPQLIWKTDASGRLSWANRAYLRLAETAARPGSAAGEGWPPAPLFPGTEFAPRGPEAETGRASLAVPGPRGGTARRWFEITRIARAAETVHFAIDVTEVVEAEQARRKFVQTLTKTFAQLAIGLAIFDRERKLVMFNPAFHDLTGLPIAFLSSRPQVQTVLDRLRDRKMLPEPRDYASWREQLAALEAQATRGTYCETWSLPGGQTYRVTGRPHPDGAVAFLFEDISAEISLTRHFRAEIETGRAVLDTLPEAMAVFSASGTRLLHNAAYEALWGAPPEGLTDTGLSSEIDRWRDRLAPTPMLSALRDFVGHFGERRAWSDRVRLGDGRGLSCRFQPLPGGATLVGFAPETPDGPRIAAARSNGALPMPTAMLRAGEG